LRAISNSVVTVTGIEHQFSRFRVQWGRS